MSREGGTETGALGWTDPTGHSHQLDFTVSQASRQWGSGHSRVLNSLWIIHECTPSPLTVAGKSKIKFFSSPEKDPINIPEVRQIHHLAFLSQTGGHLEATWICQPGLGFPPAHCVLVNEILGGGKGGGPQNYLMVLGNPKVVSMFLQPKLLLSSPPCTPPLALQSFMHTYATLIYLP